MAPERVVAKGDCHFEEDLQKVLGRELGASSDFSTSGELRVFGKPKFITGNLVRSRQEYENQKKAETSESKGQLMGELVTLREEHCNLSAEEKQSIGAGIKENFRNINVNILSQSQLVDRGESVTYDECIDMYVVRDPQGAEYAFVRHEGMYVCMEPVLAGADREGGEVGQCAASVQGVRSPSPTEPARGQNQSSTALVSVLVSVRRCYQRKVCRARVRSNQKAAGQRGGRREDTNDLRAYPLRKECDGIMEFWCAE
jgi:hypothetical protein